MACPRVLLADDLQEMRERVTELLRPDFDIVAITQNGQQAVEAASTLEPDLLILDISMPILNGIQVASRLRDLGCRARIIFLTVHDDRDYIEAAFSAGALGYVFKSHVATDLVPAVHNALQGHEFISVRDESTSREPLAQLKTHL
jgi:DNA-binding NarL/FixJ family response regulator